MALSLPTITNFLMKFTINPSRIAPVSTPENVSLPLNFGNIQIMKDLSGSYTPNDDSLDLYNFSGSPYADSCSWFLFLCDGLSVLNVSLYPSFNPAMAISVQRCCLWTGPDTTNMVNSIRSISLDGRISGPIMTPMVQSQKVNWQLLMGSGLVS